LILRLKSEGHSIRAIAKQLDVEPKTVRRVLRPKARKKEPAPSALDAFRPLIRKLVLEDELTAVRIHEEIKAVGYKAGYTILKEYIRAFRPKSGRRPHLRFETAPGKQGQVDLSPYTVLLGETWTKVVCFSMVFCFSRWQFLRFVLHADAHSVCHSHVLAFEEAGGVPHDILYDRMKQVVLESYRDDVLYHPLFEAMVALYGYTAVPLEPGYCEGKGKVEELFLFMENNFLAGRKFHDLADLNAQAKAWRNEKACREHRTTHEQPVQRLDQERPLLLPLPPKPFQAAQLEPRVVGDDFCVPWETNRYSVSPSHTGQQAWVRVLEGTLEVLIGSNEDVVAQHSLRETRHQRYILPEHEAEFRGRSTSRHVLAEQFLRLGSGAEEFAAGLREVKGAAAGYHMSKILQLADRPGIGVPRVIEALRHAIRYGAFDHNAVARIVTGRHPTASAPIVNPSSVLPSHVAEFLKGAGSFQRSLSAYERLAREQPTPPPASEENQNGQRRDGKAESPPETPEPSTRGSKPR
jgi:transposase